MKKKPLQFLWLVIVALFVVMEAYYIVNGNYDALFTSLMIISGILLLVVVYYLITQKYKK